MRALPKDWELEATVLGNYLMAPDLRNQIERIVDERDFSRPSNANLWRIMVGIEAEDGGLNSATLWDATENLTNVDTGGSAYVNELPNHATPWAPEPVLRAARRLREMTQDRHVMLAGQGLVELAGRVPRDELRVRTEELLQVLYASAEEGGRRRLGEAAKVEVEAAAERMAGTVTEDIIPTGWPSLDRLLEGGLRRTDLVIVGGRPAMGKSAVGLSLLLNAARSRRGAMMFSLEMSRGQQAQRALASLVGVPLGAIRSGRGLTPESVDRLRGGADDLNELPIFVDDRVGVSVGYIRSQVRALKRELPELAIVGVDYLQLVKGSRRGNDNRQIEVAGISVGLKEIAREERVVIVVLAQLNRDSDKRDNHRPTPADLRESGSLEQDADVILFPFRPEVYDSEDPTLTGKMELIVAKQRGGAVGSTVVRWTGQYQRIEELADAAAAREAVTPQLADTGQIRAMVHTLATALGMSKTFNDGDYVKHLQGVDLWGLDRAVKSFTQKPPKTMPRPADIRQRADSMAPRPVETIPTTRDGVPV